MNRKIDFHVFKAAAHSLFAWRGGSRHLCEPWTYTEHTRVISLVARGIIVTLN